MTPLYIMLILLYIVIYTYNIIILYYINDELVNSIEPLHSICITSSQAVFGERSTDDIISSASQKDSSNFERQYSNERIIDGGIRRESVFESYT